MYSIINFVLKKIANSTFDKVYNSGGTPCSRQALIADGAASINNIQTLQHLCQRHTAGETYYFFNKKCVFTLYILALEHSSRPY